jgi:AcrR family transcriptional regulator
MVAESNPPSPRTQAERTAQSTKALLEAASELIVEGGLSSLTFASIGERAGYSRGLVTARFGSKDGLIDALIHRIVDTWSHRHLDPAIEGANGFQAVTAILDEIRKQAEREPSGLRVLSALMFEALGPDESLRRRFASLHDNQRSTYANYVRQGIRDGSINKSVDPELEASMIVAGLRGISYQWLLDPNCFDPATSFGYLHHVISSRLAAEKSNIRRGKASKTELSIVANPGP